MLLAAFIVFCALSPYQTQSQSTSVFIKGGQYSDVEAGEMKQNEGILIKSGEVYDPQQLLKQVKGNIGPKSAEETENWFRYPELRN